QKLQSKDIAQFQILKAQAEKQEKQQTLQDSYENDLSSLKTKLVAAKSERIKLDDELEKTDSIHQAKLKLDSLVNRQTSIDLLQKSLRNEKCSLLKEAWKDLLAQKLEAKKSDLLVLQQEITNEFDEN